MTKIIIGLIGEAGAGKSTVARYLESAYDYEPVRFAGGLKKMVAAIGLTDNEIEGTNKEKPSDLLCGKTPRHAMQTLGTEWGREHIGPDFWVKLWQREAAQHAFVVVEDCRFPNEAEAIRAAGGVIVRVVNTWKEKSSGAAHSSEHQEIESDYNVFNERKGGFEHLYGYVDTVVGLIEASLPKPGPKRIYLSGPMSGLEHFNYPAFNKAAAKLRAEGHTVFNPAETGLIQRETGGFDVRAAFAEYTAWICKDADAIALLPNWYDSHGAATEYALAKYIGLEVIELEQPK
jgi:predicted kinase